MGVSYSYILWNKNKKYYDLIILSGMLLYLLIFSAVTYVYNSQVTIETLIIRSFGSLALLMLHIILIIGPLCRLSSRFLPLLYNRRHLGVSMFMAALIHGVFSLIQFHSLGNTNMLYSLLTSNLNYLNLYEFPFQVLGFFALIVLFAMAATSHDFWLHNLGAKTWKRLHMLVYVAFALIMAHVILGNLQDEATTGSVLLLYSGFIVVVALHLITGIREIKKDSVKANINDKWHYVCSVDEIQENKAKLFVLNSDRVAIFKYNNMLSAIHNECKHQGGPLAEGKIVDGCVTCPWHGYQYLAHNGQSPPPFTEKVATYNLKLEGNQVYIHKHSNPEGKEVAPTKIEP